MSRQEAKYHLSLAGEFYVAAELQRRGIAAAVTYGNAKKADVVALAGGNRAVTIEVKSTPGTRWVVGGVVPAESSAPWVFVHVPPEPTEPPAFFVLNQAQLYEILHPIDITYRRKYLEKHNQEYGEKRGVVNLSRDQAQPFKNKWNTIVALLRQVEAAG